MKSGIKIYDTDTHCSVSAEALEPYLSSRVRELIPNLDSYKQPITQMHSGTLEPPYRHRFRFDQRDGGWWDDTRVLGESESRKKARPHTAYRGGRLPTVGADEFAEVRIRDMDEEGTDVHMMVPLGANGHAIAEVEMEFIRAQHRWLNDFCGANPHRLKSLLIVTPRSLAESVEEIHAWGQSSWAVGVQPYLPLDYPLDHPDMDAIWRAAQQEGLSIVHHSFQFGYPGYRDLWRSPFIGRSASHPWAAMRFVAAITGSGIFDRFPDLRFAVLESGFGWIPWWSKRLDEQLAYVGYVAEGLQGRPSDYLTGGRFFCSLEMHEGPEMMRNFTDQMGDGVLMMGSDFPHTECRFPNSDDVVLGWATAGIRATEMQKLMWDNPIRMYGEP